MEIARLQALDLSTRLAKKRGVTLTITEDALRTAVDQGYHPAYGARPLKRFFEKAVVTQVSKLLLSGELCENGSNVVEVDSDASRTSLICRVLCPMD